MVPVVVVCSHAAYTHAASVAWSLSAIGWPRGAPAAYTNRVRTHCSPAEDQYCSLQRLPLTKLAPGWSHGQQR